VPVPESIWGLVLAGGNSRRMGKDKASLTLNGETQLSRAVRLLQSHTDQVFVSTSKEQQSDPLRQSFETIVDAYENMGPLAGILSAMDKNPSVSWLVLACDLPAIDDQTISYLLQNASPNHPATAFRSIHDNLPEPLCAVYRPAARPIIDQFVADGFRCPRKILINSATMLLDQPSPGALHNINSPEDLSSTQIKLSP
jgi:molybdopterin-guanine dinucleotide biosynthesis protein A